MSLNVFTHLMDMGMDMWGGAWGTHMAWPWGFFMGFWGILFWAILLVIGFLVYQDAEKRGMNGALWFILVIIPWIGIISLLIYLVIRETTVANTSARRRSSLEILEERYVRGEISREEYLRMKRDLED